MEVITIESRAYQELMQKLHQLCDAYPIFLTGARSGKVQKQGRSVRQQGRLLATEYQQSHVTPNEKGTKNQFFRSARTLPL